MKEAFFVFLGSGLGGALRYLISFSSENIVKFAPNFNANFGTFPFATFIVNLFGSFLLGLILAIFGKNNALQSELFLFLSVGFCGGFTTFSTFCKESLNLLQNELYCMFALYAILSVILGILALFFGFCLVK